MEMTTFALRYKEDGLGLEKRIEFDAKTPAQALLIAQGEAEGRWAELSANGKPICRLGRAGTGAGDYWMIAGSGREVEGPIARSPERRLPAGDLHPF